MHRSLLFDKAQEALNLLVSIGCIPGDKHTARVCGDWRTYFTLCVKEQQQQQQQQQIQTLKHNTETLTMDSSTNNFINTAFKISEEFSTNPQFDCKTRTRDASQILST